jgi:hypothetical protein
MQEKGSTDGVLQASPECAPAASWVARVQVGRAGRRLAKQLRELLP